MSELRWGDVLVAAIDACCVAGVDETVTKDHLAQVVADLTALSGGMEGGRGKATIDSMRYIAALRKGEDG